MRLSTLGNAISVGRLPLGCAYVLQDDYKNERTTWGKIGNLMLVPADLGGSVLFGQEAMGLVPKLFMSRCVSVLYIAAYTPIAIDALIILASPRLSQPLKRQAMLDLATSVTQITLAIFFLISYISVLLAIVAGGIACAGFLHRKLVLCNSTGTKNEHHLSIGN